MQWKDVKIGTMVAYKGVMANTSNYIGYIYKIDKERKEVKVDWSISMSEWEDYKKLVKIQVSEEFIKEYIKTLINK